MVYGTYCHLTNGRIIQGIDSRAKRVYCRRRPSDRIIFFLYCQINHVGVWLRRKGISYKFTGPKYKGRQFRATIRATVRGDPNTPTP